MAVEARYDEASGDWPKAVRTYQALFEFYPDNLEYGLRLAAAQIAAGRAADGLVTVEALRRLGAPARDDPRIDLAEAKAAGALSDLQRQVSAANRAADKGRALGARLLVAEARLAAWWAYVRLANPDQAQKVCEEARRLYAEAGDRGGEARALSSLAYVLRYFELDRPRAQKLYEESLAISREIGDKRAVANTLRGLGLALREARKPGDPPSDQPTRDYEEALALFREIGDRSGVAWVTTSLGYEAIAAGHPDEAEQKFQDALALFRELGERDGASNALMWLAGSFQSRGDLERAGARFDDMSALARETGNLKDLCESYVGAGLVLLDEGKPGAAQERLQEALRLASQANIAKDIGRILVEMAKVTLVQGDVQGSRAKLEKARTVLSGSDPAGAGKLVDAGLGWVDLLTGDRAAARRRFEGPLDNGVWPMEGDADPAVQIRACGAGPGRGRGGETRGANAEPSGSPGSHAGGGSERSDPGGAGAVACGPEPDRRSAGRVAQGRGAESGEPMCVGALGREPCRRADMGCVGACEGRPAGAWKGPGRRKPRGLGPGGVDAQPGAGASGAERRCPGSRPGSPSGAGARR